MVNFVRFCMWSWYCLTLWLVMMKNNPVFRVHSKKGEYYCISINYNDVSKWCAHFCIVFKYRERICIWIVNNRREFLKTRKWILVEVSSKIWTQELTCSYLYCWLYQLKRLIHKYFSGVYKFDWICLASLLPIIAEKENITQ